MKLLIMLALTVICVDFGYAEMKVSDFWNPDGSAKILWKDSTEEQKAQDYEWKREASEYVTANTGKKCSELRNIPEIVKLFAMKEDGIAKKPNEICFTQEPLRYVYRRSGEYDKWVEEERKYYGTRADQADPSSKREWLDVLLAAGHYREAEKFFPEYVNSQYPWLSEGEVIERLKKGERAPEELTMTVIAEPWDRILSIKGKPDDLKRLYREADKGDISKRMNRYFHSKDAEKRADALEYYRKNKVKFMIEKAKKTWKGELKNKAEEYFEDLQKSTTTQ